MPNTKNFFSRIKYLDELLSDKHHFYDINDLTEKCNESLDEKGYEQVSKRCIEKDINFIEDSDEFSVEIVRSRKSGKSIIGYSDKGSSIFTKELTEDEKNLLSEVLNTIGQFDGLNNFTWLESTGKRLGLEERRKIISFGNNPYLKNSNLLGGLFSAISAENVIDVKYQNFDSPMAKSMTVNPYLLKQYNERWYLICAIDNEHPLWNLALDRIEGFEICPGLKYMPFEGNLDEIFEDIIGVTLYESLPVEDILVWASKHEWSYIETKPLHGSQTKVTQEEELELRKKYPQFGDTGVFLKYQCKENFELMQTFISFFDGLVVLEPSSLREEIKKIIEAMSSRYSK